MEVTTANGWARDIAHYIRRHPPKPPVDLKKRIKHMTHGEGLDDNDLDQLERKVRWKLFGQPAINRRRAGPRS